MQNVHSMLFCALSSTKLVLCAKMVELKGPECARVRGVSHLAVSQCCHAVSSIYGVSILMCWFIPLLNNWCKCIFMCLQIGWYYMLFLSGVAQREPDCSRLTSDAGSTSTAGCGIAICLNTVWTGRGVPNFAISPLSLHACRYRCRPCSHVILSHLIILPYFLFICVCIYKIVQRALPPF